ncbi:MAG TPA: hypothetical protein VF795_03525 [Desulfuromonadaceae bacterium]
MSSGFHLVVAGLAVIATCVTATAAAKRPAASWSFYHFDGSRFAAGQPGDGTPFVAVRDGVRPVVLTRAGTIEAVPLGSGMGAIAGICYIQKSGGKLTAASGYVPSPHLPLEISANGRVVATLATDDRGYFVATLPAGSYRVIARTAVEVTVENGTTTLVPLRAGKRMVD